MTSALMRQMVGSKQNSFQFQGTQKEMFQCLRCAANPSLMCKIESGWRTVLKKTQKQAEIQGPPRWG
ncbi:hypothetical protein V1264_019169 [Littorina saxatilis]|uniref:Uncharacterized protein n=1 Tax=Littorina saxatilis TaxID=31220 RepID=A0AAN9BFB5_9CAEN